MGTVLSSPQGRCILPLGGVLLVGVSRESGLIADLAEGTPAI
jgi:hypothetical protein